jgi:hypothetical protein
MKITRTLANILLLSGSMLLSQQGAAAPIDPTGQPLGYIGPMELSNTNLADGGAKGYRGWFENGAWQGDLIEYDISSDGALSTSIDLSGASPKQSDGGTNWSAHVRFADTADGSSHWDTGRKIIFSNNYGNNQKAFRWQNLDLYQKEALDNLTAVDATGNASPVLNYVRGDRTNEGAAGSMRTRFTVLGDIIHSNPEYVGAPDGDYTDSDYITFKNDNASRSPTVYVGANDGMLHAFNATNGQERWAYVPSMLIPKLKQLVTRPYPHTYYVDGGITVRDAKTTNAGWRTVLVGSLGAGGRGIYALDVTKPWLSSETATGGNADKIMWEERAENTPGDPASGANPDIGYIFDASTIAQLNDGKWYAVFGNGIASDTGEAVLMLKELRTDRTDPAVIPIRTGAIGDNGLAAPALVDTDNDGKVDVAWAGDIKGAMWRFDLSGSGPGAWTSSSSVYKLYDGDPSQPITMAPDIANHPNFGHVVLFGTGKLYEDADLSTRDPQALYGIWDTGTAPANFPLSLQPQELSYNITYDRFGFDERVRTFITTVKVDYNTYKGWKVELYPGERMLTPPQLRAGRLKTTIYNPNDNTNWLHEAVFLDGNMEDNSIFNLNQDTVLDEKDRVNGNENTDADGNPDYSDPEDIPMAWKRPDGSLSQPTIASLGAGVDTMFLNYLKPHVVETAVVQGGCTGVCTGGLEGGHIDLDHDEVLDGDTSEHDHEYDDKANRTYIDFLDMVQQHDVTDDVNGGLDFIVLIANADFNKGGTLVIDTGSNRLEYNVVQYQKMIHQALADWDGSSALTTPAAEGSKPLVFKLNQLVEFKIIFNSLALITGGLHPTNTSCVQDPDNANHHNGRWRNGSLTMHMVRKSLFNSLAAGEVPLDRLRKQDPRDFQETVYLPEDGTGWAEDYYEASQNTVIEIFLEGLERTGATSLDELAAYIQGLEDSGCATVDGGTSGDKDTEESTKDDTTTTDDKDTTTTDTTTTDTTTTDTTTTDTTTTEPVSCQEDYNEATELYALGLLIEANGTKIQCNANGCLAQDNNGAGSGTSYSGDPLSIVGGIDESGITSGPNFEAGRRTWIDILPE